MKYFLPFALALFGHFQLSAQLSDSLSINNLSASFSANGGLYQSEFDFDGLRIKNADRIAIFAGSTWLGAKVNGQLKTAVQTYHLLNDTSSSSRQWESDFAAGPLGNSYTGTAYQTKYNRVWKITQNEIDHHLGKIGDPLYFPPPAIAEWPANGDTTNGEAAVLAPYFDANANGIYEPSLGDFPRIRGDEAVFIIYNDENRSNAATQTTPLKAEVHLMAYAYDSASNPALHNSIFLHYQIHNRSADDWDSLIVSNWMDADLGNTSDDLIGSDSASGLAYVYNADNFDDGPFGFGVNPPAVGLQNLRGNPMGQMYYIRTSTFPHPGLASPIFAPDYFNFMNLKWRNGHTLIVENPSGLLDVNNGDGYVSSDSGRTTRWAFEESYNWYQSPNISGDVRQLFSNQPSTLLAGEKKCYDVAAIYGRDLTGTTPFASLGTVKTYAQQNQAFFDNGNFGDCLEAIISLDERGQKNRSFRLFPNPSDGKFRLDFGERLARAEVQILDAHGKIISENSYTHTQNAELEINGAAGLYFVRINVPGQGFFVMKMVKGK